MSGFPYVLVFAACLLFGVVGFIAGYADGRSDEKARHDATYLQHEHNETYGLDTWGCLASLAAIIATLAIIIWALLHP